MSDQRRYDKWWQRLADPFGWFWARLDESEQQPLTLTREMVDALALAVSTFENDYEGTGLHEGVADQAWAAIETLRSRLPPEGP